MQLVDNDSRIVVDVCVATLNRPDGLRGTLTSLVHQQLSKNTFRVVVVDNSLGGTARSVVEEFRSDLHIKYVHEPRRGLAPARNMALISSSAPLVAFIDDDEVATPGWLSNLTRGLDVWEADVLFGSVQSKLPTESPRWAKSHPAFMKRRIKSGTMCASGSTANVIMRRHVFSAGVFFDEEFSRTGGEDLDFFYRLGLEGKTLIWCAEAEVVEEIERRRVTIGWVIRRSFRSGQTFYRAVTRRTPLHKRMYRFMLSFCMGVATFPCILGFWFPLPILVRGLTIHASSLGQLTGGMGRIFRLNEYGDRLYRAGDSVRSN